MPSRRKRSKIMDTETMFTLLEVYGIATEDEIALVSAINGYNEETALDILYVRTGYRSFEQFEDED